MEKMALHNPSEETLDNTQENPNVIGDLSLSISTDVPTSPEFVYRGVYGDAALHDLEQHGEVRNKFSAGATTKNRWGANVYWSRGVEGKFHNVQNGGYVIEAPHDVAAERAVRKDDVTAIYGRNDEGTVEDVKHRFLTTGAEQDRQSALQALRQDMGAGETQQDDDTETAA